MWPPRVGVTELAILAIVCIATPFFVTRDSRWLFGIIPCFALAVLFTPPDPGSMILAGGGLSVLYVVAVLLSKLILGGRDDDQ